MKLTLLPATQDDVTRIRCDGLLTLRHQPPASDPLQELLGSQCFGRKVLLNLERAQGIDTSGASWLMRVDKKFNQAKGRLVLVMVPPTVTQVLNVLRVIPLLHIAQNEGAGKQLALQHNGPAAPDEGPISPTARPPGFERPPQAV
jgi:anti-anti-sigma factor